MKKRRILALVTMVVFVLSTMVMTFAAGSDNAANKQELNINIYQEPSTLDFQACTNNGEIQIYNWIMEGLTRSIGNGKIKPGIAYKWEQSTDGKTWTFHLREASWTDGQPVKAQDFVYGWLRAIDPQKPTDYSYFLYDIKNAQAFCEGKAKASEVGIKAVDDKTLEVTLLYPVTYFDFMVSSAVFAPVREDIYEKYKEKYNTEADYFVTNGPFILSDWQHETSMTFTKNQKYWDAQSVKLQTVSGLMVDSYSTELSLYQAGMLDHTISLKDEDKISLKKGKVESYTDGSVWYIGYNCSDKILKNKNIRKALTLAINRTQFIKEFGTVPMKAAFSMVQPEIIPDYDGKTFREKKPAFFQDNDVKTAKKLFAQGLKELKLKKLPTLTILIPDDTLVYEYAKTIGNMWSKNLGVKLAIEYTSNAERMKRQNAHQYQVTFAGWGPDYPDAMTDLDLFLTGGGNNVPGYSNAKYDALIKKAKMATDKKLRSELMHQAEQMLMDDMPIGPLYFRYRNYAVREYVKNFTRDSFAPDINFIYSYIEGKNE